MSEAAVDSTETYAVVVGVETYGESAWNLNGPARDAARFVRWLRSRGVPAGNIDLIASPWVDKDKQIDNQAILDALDVLVKAKATRDAIRREFVHDLPARLRTAKPGSLLWVFWGGHGVMTGALERRLLFAESSAGDYVNLDLDSLLARLRDLDFARVPRQIVVVDACSHYKRVLPAPPETYPLQTLEPAIQQFVTLATGPGEGARNLGVDRSGLFSRELLTALEESPEAPFPPRVRTIMNRLMASFARLETEGKPEQTPTTLEYRPWSNQRVRFGNIPRPVPLAGAWPALGADAVPHDLRRELARILEQCEIMQDLLSRNELLREMDPVIRAYVQYAPTNIRHIQNIVHRCLNVSGGIEVLFDRVLGSQPGADQEMRLNELRDRLRELRSSADEG